MTTTPIRVLSTLGVLGVVRGLLPAAEAAGFQPEIRFDPTARLVAAIEAGERADIAILTSEGIAAQDYLGEYLGVEKRYYEPTDRGFERELSERLAEIRRRLKGDRAGE